MGFRDYLETRRGYHARETRRFDELKLVTRRLATLVAGAAWGKDSPLKDETDFLPLSWETTPEAEPDYLKPTADELAALTARLNAHLK